MDDDFNDDPKYNDGIFWNWYRMPNMFLKIVRDIEMTNERFQEG